MNPSTQAEKVFVRWNNKRLHDERLHSAAAELMDACLAVVRKDPAALAMCVEAIKKARGEK